MARFEDIDSSQGEIEISDLHMEMREKLNKVILMNTTFVLNAKKVILKL